MSEWSSATDAVLRLPAPATNGVALEGALQIPTQSWTAANSIPASTSAKQRLQILVLESSAPALKLLLQELNRSGLAHVAKCVSSRTGLLDALAQFQPDAVLCAAQLP